MGKTLGKTKQQQTNSMHITHCRLRNQLIAHQRRLSFHLKRYCNKNIPKSSTRLRVDAATPRPLGGWVNSNIDHPYCRCVDELTGEPIFGLAVNLAEATQEGNKQEKI